MKEIWTQSNYYFSQIWDGWMLKVPLATVAGFYTGHLNGDWVLLLVFSAMIVVDLVFGTWLAVRRQRFDVRLFGRWVVKVGTHFFVIFIVGLAIRSILEPLGIGFPLLDLFLGMLICTEALSVLKNMQRLGLPVPRLATRILTDVQEKAEQKATDFFSRPENDRRRGPGRKRATIRGKPMMIKIKVLAGILGILVLAGWAAYTVSIRAELFGKTEQLKAAEQAIVLGDIENKGLRLELEANQAALAEREQVVAALASQTETLRYELSELYLNNEPCATWADGVIPGPVLDRVR